MLHYSCDRCKRVLEADELRYVVKLEAYAAMDPIEPEDSEDDRDHLLEIQEILERLEDEENPEVAEEVYSRRRYDLCAECCRKFMQNPVGREAPVQLGFSSN